MPNYFGLATVSTVFLAILIGVMTAALFDKNTPDTAKGSLVTILIPIAFFVCWSAVAHWFYG